MDQEAAKMLPRKLTLRPKAENHESRQLAGVIRYPDLVNTETQPCQIGRLRFFCAFRVEQLLS